MNVRRIKAVVQLKKPSLLFASYFSRVSSTTCPSSKPSSSTTEVFYSMRVKVQTRSFIRQEVSEGIFCVQRERERVWKKILGMRERRLMPVIELPMSP